MELLRDVGHVESHFSPFGRKICARFCAKRTIGSKIILDTLDGILLGFKAQLEARFGPFGDSANLDAR
jgi:hypothetical protein